MVLPGATGTLTELAYAWELINKQFLPGRILVIMGDFWLPVVELVEGVSPRSLGLVHRVDSPAELAEVFAAGLGGCE